MLIFYPFYHSLNFFQQIIKVLYLHSFLYYLYCCIQLYFLFFVLSSLKFFLWKCVFILIQKKIQQKKTDEVLSINLSANVFVFGDFNFHHKDKLTYSDGTDRPGELCYNVSISNDLTQIVNFPTQIPDSDSHSPALLDFFLSSDAGICSTMTFSPLRKSDHVVVSISIDFPSNSQHFVFLYFFSLCDVRKKKFTTGCFVSLHNL